MCFLLLKSHRGFGFLPRKSLVPDHDGPPLGTAVSAQPKVRTQTCMNLCEVGLVIVKLGVSKTSRKGIGSTTDLTLS